MPTPEPLLLGLDIGTSRIKALMVDRAGGEVRVEARATPFVTRSEGVEMTVGLLDEATASVVRAMGDLRGRVVGVGIAGMAESGAPLDAAGEALGPVLAWHDPRGSDVVARLVDRFGDELAGWIGQPVRTVSSVAKLGWLVDHGVTGVASWAGVPELCLGRLTGVQMTEYSLAARTGWYHVRERRYLPEVARAIGTRLGPEVFLPVEPAGRAMGRLSADGAAWSGLPVGIPVTLAGHDHLVGMVGSGAGPDDAVNSVGTAESVLRARSEPPDMAEARALRIAVSVMPGGERWAVLAGAARAGLVLARTAEALGHTAEQLDRLAASGGHTAEQLDRLAASGAPDFDDASDLLEQIERGGPVTAPLGDAGAVWNGMHTALARRTREALGRLEALVGPVPRLVAFGGGSRSLPARSARARQALEAGVPLWRSTATEAVARGAALYAGVAAGWWPSVDAGPRVPLEVVVGPDSHNCH